MRWLLVLLLIGVSPVAADTFTYGRDGATEALDVSLRGGADSATNFYDQTLLRQDIIVTDSSDIYQMSLIWFDCASDISGATIDSAFVTLRTSVWDGGTGTDSSFVLRLMLVNWVHNQANATIYSTGNRWNTFAARGSGTDYTTTGQATAEAAAVGSDGRWDVTTIVQAWADGTSNYGFGIYGAGNIDFTRVDFASAEAVTQTQRPRLQIYTSSGATGAQVIMIGRVDE